MRIILIYVKDFIIALLLIIQALEYIARLLLLDCMWFVFYKRDIFG